MPQLSMTDFLIERRRLELHRYASSSGELLFVIVSFTSWLAEVVTRPYSKPRGAWTGWATDAKAAVMEKLAAGPLKAVAVCPSPP